MFGEAKDDIHLETLARTHIELAKMLTAAMAEHNRLLMVIASQLEELNKNIRVRN